MVALYAALTVLILTLAVVTTYMAISGGLGAFGSASYVRCSFCRLLTPLGAIGRSSKCVHCRHPVLFQPVHASRFHWNGGGHIGRH
ncbi:MAG TPA: hypothetical protein VG435_00875 [Acidimicrobiales bacterium]|jgi:hypothetical protein|nr:hypothetical protein [Acidimicrobiales bacterium]